MEMHDKYNGINYCLTRQKLFLRVNYQTVKICIELKGASKNMLFPNFSCP